MGDPLGGPGSARGNDPHHLFPAPAPLRDAVHWFHALHRPSAQARAAAETGSTGPSWLERAEAQRGLRASSDQVRADMKARAALDGGRFRREAAAHERGLRASEIERWGYVPSEPPPMGWESARDLREPVGPVELAWGFGDRWRIIPVASLLTHCEDGVSHLVLLKSQLGIWVVRFCIKPSRIPIWGSNGGIEPCGLGLFSARSFPDQTRLTYYWGEAVSLEEAQILKSSGLGRSLMYRFNQIIDGRLSKLGSQFINDGTSTANNCLLRGPSAFPGLAAGSTIEATEEIEPNTEIRMEYGGDEGDGYFDYDFPAGALISGNPSASPNLPFGTDSRPTEIRSGTVVLGSIERAVDGSFRIIAARGVELRARHLLSWSDIDEGAHLPVVSGLQLGIGGLSFTCTLEAQGVQDLMTYSSLPAGAAIDLGMFKGRGIEGLVTSPTRRGLPPPPLDIDGVDNWEGGGSIVGLLAYSLHRIRDKRVIFVDELFSTVKREGVGLRLFCLLADRHRPDHIDEYHLITYRQPFPGAPSTAASGLFYDSLGFDTREPTMGKRVKGTVGTKGSQRIYRTVSSEVLEWRLSIASLRLSGRVGPVLSLTSACSSLPGAQGLDEGTPPQQWLEGGAFAELSSQARAFHDALGGEMEGETFDDNVADAEQAITLRYCLAQKGSEDTSPCTPIPQEPPGTTAEHGAPPPMGVSPPPAPLGVTLAQPVDAEPAIHYPG